MLISNTIKKAKVSFPVIEGIGGPSFLGRVKLKNIYQGWNGESFQEIVARNENNPFNIRIGLPHTDKQMKEDKIFLFTKYLSYNPITKQIEKRELVPLRNTEKVYIGHSPEEHMFYNYKLFVDGDIVADNITFKSQQLRNKNLQDIILDLYLKIDILEKEVLKLRSIKENVAIY